MSTILWLEWVGFYASEFPAEDRDLVIVRERSVLDANHNAKKKGVTPGQELAQAKSLAHGCVVKAWNPEEFQAKRDRWLDVCTQYSGYIEPVDQHIAALDLSLHADPIDISERLIRDLLVVFPLRLKYGLAGAKWIARLAANRNDYGSALRDPKGFLAALSCADLLPVSPEARERLRFLGYPTIGHIAKIPQKVLQEQFGEEGIVISNAARGSGSDPVAPLYPLDSVHDSIYFESPVEDWETVRLASQKLCNRLGARLQEKNLQGSVMTVSLVPEDQPAVETKRKFTKPFYHPLSVLSGCALLLHSLSNEFAPTDLEQQKGPLITGIRIGLSDLRQGKYVQPKLNGFIAAANERPEAESALAYVKTVFGNGAIKLANEIESPRRVQVLKEWQHATGWR